jgi:F-type H+-transporting ATPase subunit gamma
MADTKTIKNKIKSVGNIGKITRAMEMVARSKMKRAIDAALAIRPFAFFGLEFLVNFSYHNAAQSIFYKVPEEASRTLIIEIAANKGLCGGYNASMYRELRKYLINFTNQNLENIDFIAVGKYATQHIKLLNGNLIKSFNNLTENITLAEVLPLVQKIKEEYSGGKYKEVLIAFTNFVSTLSQKPHLFQLLPLSKEAFKNQLVETGDEENRIDIAKTHFERDWSAYVIEPNEDEILDIIIPKLVTFQIYQAILEAFASEQAARMMAMKNATENAESLGEELSLQFNHLRQEGITRELSEIAAGAEMMR